MLGIPQSPRDTEPFQPYVTPGFALGVSGLQKKTQTPAHLMGKPTAQGAF